MQTLTIDLYSFKELPTATQDRFILEEIQDQVNRISDGFPPCWVNDEEDEVGNLVRTIQCQLEEEGTEYLLPQRLKEDETIVDKLRSEAIRSLNYDDYWTAFFLYQDEYIRFEHSELLY